MMFFLPSVSKSSLADLDQVDGNLAITDMHM